MLHPETSQPHLSSQRALGGSDYGSSRLADEETEAPESVLTILHPQHGGGPLSTHGADPQSPFSAGRVFLSHSGHFSLQWG